MITWGVNPTPPAPETSTKKNHNQFHSNKKQNTKTTTTTEGIKLFLPRPGRPSAVLLRRSIGRRHAGRIAAAAASGGSSGRRGMGWSEAEGNVTVRRVFPGPAALLLGEGAGLHRRGGAVVCGGGERLRRGRRLVLLRHGGEGELRGGGGQHGGDGGGGIRADVGGTVGCGARHDSGRRWAERLARVHCVGSSGEYAWSLTIGELND